MTLFEEYQAPPAPPAPPVVFDRDAYLSENGKYRYLLTRTWDAKLPTACWIMLNPSTADAMADDPTIRRCVSFSHREGCGSLAVVNLFAFRATDPYALGTTRDPVGPGNVEWVTEAIEDAFAAVVIAAWGGSAPKLTDRQRQPPDVAAIAAKAGRSLKCLGTTQSGAPRHPLYIRGDAPLIDWSGS